MVEAHKRNKTKKFCISARGIKVSFWLSTFLYKGRVNNLAGNDTPFMEIQKHFYESLNSKDDMDIRDEVKCQGPDAQIELPTKDEVLKIIRTLKNNQSPGEDNISAGHKKLSYEIHALTEITQTSERMPENSTLQ